MSTEIETKERPILFSGLMVRAILDGRKTQTRRVIDLSPSKVLSLGQRKLGWTYNVELARVGDVCKMVSALRGETTDYDAQQISVPARHPEDSRLPWEDCGYERVYCPYGGPGDQLWVREAWQAYQAGKKRFGGKGHLAGAEFRQYANPPVEGESVIEYRDDHPTACHSWRPSIHMPRWAARIILEITGVRVERLNDMSQSDLDAEGFGCESPLAQSEELGGYDEGFAWFEFMRRWDSVNGKGSWSKNPWVWVIEFKRVTT